jgi:hypothetical protein
MTLFKKYKFEHAKKKLLNLENQEIINNILAKSKSKFH